MSPCGLEAPAAVERGSDDKWRRDLGNRLTLTQNPAPFINRIPA
jgi:hypothetical protein